MIVVIMLYICVPGLGFQLPALYNIVRPGCLPDAQKGHPSHSTVLPERIIYYHNGR